MAPLFISVPWDSHYGQALDPSACQNAADITANLTQHTNYSCLSAVDMGSIYGTHKADYATWDGSKCTSWREMYPTGSGLLRRDRSGPLISSLP